MYNNKINTIFHDNKIPEECVRCVCLSVILLDFIVKVGEKYYLPTLEEECRYAVKKIKNIISKELTLDESDDDYEESDEPNEENH